MKRFSLAILCVMLTTSHNAHAQLHVENNGDVKINTSSVVSKFTVYDGGGKGAIYGQVSGLPYDQSEHGYTLSAIKGHTTHSGSHYSIGIHGIAYGNTSSLQGYCSGVVGEAKGGENGHNYGICGFIPSSVKGAAVYGTSNESLLGPTLTTNYAGFFNGILGTSGPIYGMLTSTAVSNSDSNIMVVDDLSSTSHAERLAGLKSSTLYITGGEFADRNQLHYALDADQLEELYPDLVIKSDDGSKRINYVEMVPILVQAISELKDEIRDLRGGDAKRQTRALEGNNDVESVTLLSLGENRPNPFASTTVIPVNIPDDVQQAFIYVYDLTGKKVHQQNIMTRGKHDVTLDASVLTDGMYLYSLIADGKVVQTRRMIVEK